MSAVSAILAPFQTPVLAHSASGGFGTWGFDEWLYLAFPIMVYGFCVMALVGLGRTDETNPVRAFFASISESFRRLTGHPGWSMAGALTGLMALVIAVVGFYWDVAWHIDLGRDDVLFTPSHVMILVGLGGLAFAAGVAIVFATMERSEAGFRVMGLQVPWSALVLGAMGLGAVAAFPLDNLWHQAYGVDVTLWSPTHLQLVGGGSLSTLAIWLMLAEGRAERSVAGGSTGMGTFINVVAAGAALTGMNTFLGEFDYGVPQFQVLYLPVLVTIAGAFLLVTARATLGRFGALSTVGVYLVLRLALLGVVTGALNHTPTRFPLYIATAVLVEGVAAVLGTQRRLRFGALTGLVVGTLGVIAELSWLIPPGASTTTDPTLLARLAVLGPLAGLAAGVLGAGFARGFSADAPAEEGTTVPLPALAAAVVGLLVVLAVPSPRQVGEVDAVVTLTPAGQRDGADLVSVDVALDPPDAAESAAVFGVASWQGGGQVVTTALIEVAPGRYRSQEAVPASGRWKSTIGLQRGNQVMAVPVYLPADPEIGAPLIAALPVRQTSFVRNTDLLLREAHPGPAWPAVLSYLGVGLLAALWLALLCLAARRVGALSVPPSAPRTDAPAAARSGRGPKAYAG